MTDEYGADHSEQAGHSDTSHDLKPETWTDDHPPVDDFADVATEETATAMASEELGAIVDDAPQPVQRKTPPLLPIAAGIGGLLVLGGLLYWQFGSSTSAPVPAAPVRTAIAPEAAPPLLPPSAVPTAVEPSSDIGNLKAEALGDTAPKTAMASVPEASALPQPPPASAPGIGTENNLADIIHVEPAAAPATPPSAEAMPPKPDAPLPVPVVDAVPDISLSKEVMETRLDRLAGEVDQLKKALDQANQQLSQLGLAGGANGGSSGLEARLAKLEQQMAQTRSASAGIRLDDADSPETAKAKPATKPKTVGSSSKKKSRKSSKSARASAPAPKPQSWVLRAATPTEAWVAASASAVELRHVEVGDQLPGIGRISAIRQSGGSWVVEGTHGTVR